MGDQLVYQLSLFCDYVTVPSVNWTSSNLKDILGTVEVDTPCDGLQGRAEHMFEDLMAKADKGHYTLTAHDGTTKVTVNGMMIAYQMFQKIRSEASAKTWADVLIHLCALYSTNATIRTAALLDMSKVVEWPKPPTGMSETEFKAAVLFGKQVPLPHEKQLFNWYWFGSFGPDTNTYFKSNVAVMSLVRPACSLTSAASAERYPQPCVTHNHTLPTTISRAPVALQDSRHLCRIECR